MINRSKGKVVLPIFESSAAGNSKLPQSTLPPRDDRIMRAFKQHPFPLLLISLVFVRLVVLLTSNKFAFVRTAFVTTHFHVMPTLFPKGDHSEGGLFTHVGLTVPTEYRGEGNGGCVWDVGANNGVWNSNSYYLINALGFKGFLYEADAGTFLNLRDLYGKQGAYGDRVKLFNYGLSDKQGRSKFRVFPMGFENTMIEEKNNQFDSQVFEYEIAVRDAKEICEQKKQNKCSYSVLSIDVEGLDGLVLKNAHLPDCMFDIVILETSNDMQMKRLGYKLLTSDHYNKIYVKKQIDI